MKKQLVKIAKPVIERFPKLAMTYRAIRDNWRAYEEVKETPMGFKLAGNKLMQSGQFEPEETQIVTRILPDIDIFVNVGANIGYYCCLALSHAKPVIAFEPIHLNLRYLLKNIKANNWDSGIEVYPMALSDKVGVVEIYGGGTGASLLKGWAGTSRNYATLVPSTTLDNVLSARLKGKVSFILVDIEGAEQSLLEGAGAILGMTPKPVWMVEISISEHQPRGITLNPNLLSTFAMFWRHGYEAWTAKTHYGLVRQGEIEEIVRTGIDTLQTHNFLFLEKGQEPRFLAKPD